MFLQTIYELGGLDFLASFLYQHRIAFGRCHLPFRGLSLSSDVAVEFQHLAADQGGKGHEFVFRAVPKSRQALRDF
jgi:hypothetical protein